MRSLKKTLIATLAAAALLTSSAQANPFQTQPGAKAGADRLMSIQNPDGSFNWQVGVPGIFQNVQGITGLALLEAFKVTLDPTYIDDGSGHGAQAMRNWIAAYRVSSNPPKALSAPNIFFLAEYAALTGNVADLALARTALDERITQFGGTPASVVTFIIQARKNQGHTNLGLWDAAFYVRAAQELGRSEDADEMANALATQTIVDPLDPAANWFELGLTGMMLGLSEAGFASHVSSIQTSGELLKARQAANGSFPITFGGVPYPDDTQTTAYAVMALMAAGEIQAALAGAEFLLSVQRSNGGFEPSPGDTTEFAEIDSEATMALAAATMLVPNGVLAYLDDARAAL